MSETTTTTATESSSAETTFNLETLIGMAKEAAFTTAKAAGFAARVLEEDGEVMMGTMEVNPKRVNFSIVEGIISKVKLG